jgi:hypothetical protein
VQSKPESPAPASARTITAFRPVAIDLQSLGPPPILPVVFGFCQHAGLLNSAHKLFMTPVFRIQNSAGEASGVLAQRYVREYKLANDPGKKMKQSSELCSVAGNYAEAEVLRRDLLSAYEMPNATGSGPVLTPIMTEWSPAGGAIVAAPEGAAVALQIICSVPDHARKTVYYTGMFAAPGADAAAQLSVVQKMHADYRKYIVDVQQASTASAATCTASENPAFVDQMTAVRAELLVKLGYTALRVDWKPAE